MLKNEEFESIREFINIDGESLGKIKETLIDEANFSYKIYVRLKPTCILKRVRLFIIFRALNELGQICFTIPDTQALESGDFKLDFEIYLISQKKTDEILKVLDEIMEIENKYVIEKSKDEFLALFSDFISEGSVNNEKVGNETGTLVKENDQEEHVLNNEILHEESGFVISQAEIDKITENLNSLNDLQKDALKEIGNIGAGNAANALAGLINRRVDINIPSVQIVELEKYINNIAKNNLKLVTSWSIITGDNRATILIMFKLSDVMKLVSIMIEGMEGSKAEFLEDDINSINDLPELYISALSELGNILANHYSIALGNLLELKLITEPPGISVDVGKQLHDTINKKAGLYNGLSLLIATTIMIKDLMISGTCTIVPESATLDKLLDALSKFI